MAEKFKNIIGLFKEGRTRAILITTFAALFIAIVIGIISIRSRMVGNAASATIQQTPGNIQSVPFNAPSQQYANLQKEQNAQQAKSALKSGESAIPTIVQAEKLQQLPPNSEYGVGFTGLSREQGDGDTFQAKSFGNGAQNNCAIPVGSPVCNEQNQILGFVEQNGKVRGINGQIIGNAEPNGIVTDAGNKTLGRVCTNRGTPIYDKNGNLIGYLGPDGKVRNLNGQVIGMLGADGKIRDLNGNIIGEVGTAPPGSPVYDKNGNLIGYVDKDGKIRDANGNIIGSVGADGIAKDLSGKEIGRAGSIVSGTPVYDANGHLIGYVGPDGKVRDASGRVIGTLGADGLVRDANGKVIGRVGTPVYDANGHLIGFVGPDGKVRNSNGEIIGTVGPDGVVRDLNGKIIGKAGAISPGTTVCNSSGKSLGIIGPDGKVRGTNDEVVGYINVNGEVQDSQGLVVGSINCKIPTDTTVVSTTSLTPNLPGPMINDSAELSRQNALLNQQTQNQLQQVQQSMTQQASQLLVAWTSPQQQMVMGDQHNGDTNGNTLTGTTNSANGTNAATPAGPIVIRAGTIYYGTLKTAVNSDEPGPIMVTIINGPYKSATLLGELTNQGQAIKLTFNILSTPQFANSIAINAVAIDQDTARTALSTYTDNHYLLRFGSLFAASFLQGYAQAITQSGSQSTTGLNTTTTRPNLSGSEKFYVALGNVGTQFSGQLGNIFNTPPTVYVASGTAVGILFLADVTLPVGKS